MTDVLTAQRWSLRRLCRETGVPRGVARAALRAGLIEGEAWSASDTVVLQVAAAVLSIPGDPARVDERNLSAVALAAGLLAKPAGESSTLLVGAARVELARSSASLSDVAARFPGEPVTTLPISEWMSAVEP